MIGLCSGLNRSGITPENPIYVPKRGIFKDHILPVAWAMHRVFPEYEQDHPYVVDDIKAGKLEMDVKANWGRLLEAMIVTVSLTKVDVE